MDYGDDEYIFWNYLLYYISALKGVLKSTLTINGFAYMGAITRELVQETENQTKQNMQKLPEKICFEDGLCLNFKDKTRNVFNQPLDSGWVELESMVGNIMLDASVTLCKVGFGETVPGAAVCGIIFAAGSFFYADANGLITDFFSTNKLLETGFDIGLTFLPNPMLSNAKKSFKYAVKESKFLDDVGQVGTTVKVTLSTFAAVQNALYEEVKSKIKKCFI